MLYQLSYARAPDGGGRIRTFVGCRRQIYSLLPLATRAPHQPAALVSSFPPNRVELPHSTPTDNAPRVPKARGVCVPPKKWVEGGLFLFGNVS